MPTTYSTYRLGAMASLKFLTIEKMPPHFSAHVYYGKTAGWIRIPLILDLIITAEDLLIESLQLHDASSLTDHMCLTFQLPLLDCREVSNCVRCVSRNWSVFDAEAFEAELAESELSSAHSDDVDWLFNE